MWDLNTIKKTNGTKDEINKGQKGLSEERKRRERDEKYYAKFDSKKEDVIHD